MLEKWSKITKHLALHSTRSLTMSLCILLNSLFTPLVVSPAFAKARQVSEIATLSKIDPDVLRVCAQSVIFDKKTGAIGNNRSHYISVGLQKYSSYLIAYGIVSKNLDVTANGIKVLEYAFAYRNLDGSFLHRNGSRRYNEADDAITVAFLFHDLGRSLLLLQNSDWFQKSAETDKLRRRIDKISQAANLSLTWLINRQDFLKADLLATNRQFIYADAFYLVGKALNRPDAMQVGEDFARTAIQQQTESGVFLENGGYDSSYQGVSLSRALWLYTNLNKQTNSSLVQDLWHAITRGTNWQMTQILPTGEVSTKGNSRVYPGGERYLGKEKGVAYIDIIIALNYYARLSGSKLAQSKTELVLSFFKQKYPRAALKLINNSSPNL